MPFDVVEKQVVYDGKKLRLELHRLRLPGGRVHTREVVAHRGAVVILPIAADDTVLMIRNYRHTVGDYLLEIPAGTLEAGEEPLKCAERELIEETGYAAASLQPMAGFYASPGILTEKMHTFLATGLTPRAMKLDEGEAIEVVPMPLSACIAAIGDGRIVDSKTIATLLYYERFVRKGQ